MKVKKQYANEQAKEDLVKQSEIVKKLLQPDQSPYDCIKANYEMMKLFVKYVETITSL